MWHLFLKNVEENNKAEHLRLVLTFLFCIFQTKLNKAVNIFLNYQNGSEMYKWCQVLVQDLDENMYENLNEDLDENLAWQTQKTEDPKSNKGNLTFPPHTVNGIELNCK